MWTGKIHGEDTGQPTGCVFGILNHMSSNPLKPKSRRRGLAIAWTILICCTANGQERPGYLGVNMIDLTADRATALKLKSANGVEIVAVVQNSPAAEAGLKEHDVIVSFKGQPVNNLDQLQFYIRQAPATSGTLGIIRAGQAITVPIQIATRLVSVKDEADENALEFGRRAFTYCPAQRTPRYEIVLSRSISGTGTHVREHIWQGWTLRRWTNSQGG